MRPFPRTIESLVEVPFLTEPDWSRFVELLSEYGEEIAKGDSVLVASLDPVEALAATFAAIIRKGRVFLGNPQWQTSEWIAASDMASFDRVYGVCQVRSERTEPRYVGPPLIMIPSGGTSGKTRFCVHTVDTLSAAVENLWSYHEGRSLSSISVLGVFHVSGLMPVVRACLTGGCVHLAKWKDLVAGSYPSIPHGYSIVSLVPTQLSQLIQTDAGLQFLHGLDAIYVGGAAATPALVNAIRTEKLPVLFVYGMTETAAMVVVGTRADTDSAGAVWGKPLPGVRIEISDDQQIMVGTNSLYQGYFPTVEKKVQHVTGDIGQWTFDGQLQVLGRKDFLINSGGEKVNPMEVEQLIADYVPGKGVAVSSRPSETWGEALVAVVEAELSNDQKDDLFSYLSQRLAPYKIPKAILTGIPIPRSSVGKINRAQLKDLIRDRFA